MLEDQDDLNLVLIYLSMSEIREFPEYRCWRDRLVLGKKDVFFTQWVLDLGQFFSSLLYDCF